MKPWRLTDRSLRSFRRPAAARRSGPASCAWVARRPPQTAMSTQAPLSPEEIAALQFLDRQPGEWYCTQCWARGVGGDVRVLHRFSVLMETTQALAPGHEAIANGPCGTCDPKGPRGAVLKSGRSVRSRGTRVKP